MSKIKDIPKVVLPPIQSCEELLNKTLPLPPELVKGLIHKRELVMVGGGSKSQKSWALLDLALSIAHGTSWWGRETVQGRVLYLNFEISEVFFQRRIDAVAQAKALSRPHRNVDVWNLRGCAADIALLAPGIIEHCANKNYSLLVFDPIYKLLGGRDENKAGDVAAMLNSIEQISEGIGGAATAYAQHYTKGNASQKASIDRVSGSGVYARQPDTIIALTRHKEEGAFVVEPTLRNFAPCKPFVVNWEFPLFDIDGSGLDRRELERRPGRVAQYTVADVLDCLKNGMTTAKWRENAINGLGLSERTFRSLKSEAVREGRVELHDKTWFHTNIVSFKTAVGNSGKK